MSAAVDGFDEVPVACQSRLLVQAGPVDIPRWTTGVASDGGLTRSSHKEFRSGDVEIEDVIHGSRCQASLK